MKKAHALFLLILGSFLLVTAAFAENTSLDQVSDPALWKSGASETLSVPKLNFTVSGATAETAALTTPIAKTAPAGVPALKAETPAPAKTEEQGKGLFGKLSPEMLLAGIGVVNLGFIIATGAVPLFMGIATLFGIGLLFMK